MDLEPPDYASLINPIACNAFAMRYGSRQDKAKSFSLDRMHPDDLIALDEVTYCQVTDADMLVAPYVKIATPLPARVAAELLLARITLTADGEHIIQDEFLDRFLLRPPFSGCVSGSQILVNVGLKTEKDLLGTCKLTFLPNKSRIQVLIRNLPRFEGKVDLVVGAILLRYTTKAKAGSLFEVGCLDKDQNTYPVRSSWTERQDGSPPLPLSGEQLDLQRSQLLGQALREEERLRQARLEAEQTTLAMKAAFARAMAGGAQVPTPLGEAYDQAVAAGARVPTPSELKEAYARTLGVDAPPPPPMPKMLKDEAVWNPLDEQLSRAKGRLIRWGITATLAMVAAAGTLLLVYKYLKDLP